MVLKKRGRLIRNLWKLSNDLDAATKTRLKITMVSDLSMKLMKDDINGAKIP